MGIRHTVLAAACLALLATDSSAELSFKSGDSTLALEKDGEAVWQFHYGTDLSKAYFHPVAVPGIGSLTELAPEDHPWHHAMWFSWKYINGVNYWEEDRRTGRSSGRTKAHFRGETQGADYSAEFRIEIYYGLADEEPILKEDRIIALSPPAADGSYHMDWTCEFTAVSDAVLDRTPVAPEGWNSAPGGYAGLSVRFSPELMDCSVTDSDGVITEQTSRIRVNTRAVDYHGAIDGKAVGLAILDHPGNLNAPTPWYIINTGNNGTRFFSPAVIHNGPHEMKAGDTMTLRYRVLVHPGKLDGEALQAALKEFTDN